MAAARIALCLGLAVGGSQPSFAQTSLQPKDWDKSVRLREAQDLNPDPHIVEINIETRVADVELGPGQHVDAWTYDGGVPGPLIRAKPGDRVIVHFRNRLPQPTTIHWHGIRLNIEMDGVPGISQPPVKTDETFTYDFVVPDAGLYWYHPHIRSAEQVGFGVYGPLLVQDPAEDARIGVPDELVVVISDIDVDEDGKLADPETGATAGMAFGREGNIVLTNGHIGSVGRVLARSGAPQRWRILNAAKSRYFALDLDGQPFVKIGSDGGLAEYSTSVTSLVLGPGERADVLVTPTGAPGSELPVRSLLYNRGYGSVEMRKFDELLFTIAFTQEPRYTGPPLPQVRRAIAALDASGATRQSMHFTIEQLPNGDFQYGINHKPYWESTPFVAKLGETQLWTLVNETAWSHPFHLHGFFFQVVDEKGAPVHPIEWKDTVNVPFRASPGVPPPTVHVLVRFDERPGTWMIHCHVLDHADGGLMSGVRVGLPPPTTGDAFAHPHVMRY